MKSPESPPDTFDFLDILCLNRSWMLSIIAYLSTVEESVAKGGEVHKFFSNKESLRY